jgi:WD40 repeat protein
MHQAEEPTFEYTNEEAIDEELLCSHICYKPLVDPVSHNDCLNSFCRECAKKIGWKCPICRKGAFNDYTAVNTRVVLNMLAKIRVKCSQCSKEMPRGDFNAHKPNCPFPCYLGCGINVTQLTAAKHMDECEHIAVPCPAHTVGCDINVPRRYLQEHINSCRWEQSRWIIELLQAKINLQSQEMDEMKQDMNKLRDLINSLPRHRSYIIKGNCVNVFKYDYEDFIYMSDVKSLIQLANGQLASASGCVIHIWDLFKNMFNNGGWMHTLPIGLDSTYDINSLIQLKDERLACGCNDNAIRIMHLNGGSHMKILEGHTNAVWSIIQLRDGRLASGSADNTIRIWNVDSGKCTLTLACRHSRGKESSLKFSLIQLADERLVSAGSEICIWDLKKRRYVKSFQGSPYGVSSLIYLANERLASVSAYDTNINIWDINSGQCVKCIPCLTDKGLNSIIQLSDGQLVTGGNDNTIRFWDLSGECIRVLRGHTATITSLLQLTDGRLASGSRDVTVRIWE